MTKLTIGIIREGKTPPDSRVPLTPKQCRHIIDNYPVDIKVSPSPGRCYPDEEYKEEGIEMVEDLRACDLLMGVKEVPIDLLIPNKVYHFFSHTIKKQVYNRKLLRACIDKNIRLIDYEVLTNEKGQRLIAFGIFAGMVGAHNALMTYGRRTQEFSLSRMKDYFDYAAAVADYKTMDWAPCKIVLTGGGRVGTGAKNVLDDMGIKEVNPNDFLNMDFNEAVYTQLDCPDYVERKDGTAFDRQDFYTNAIAYQSSFEPYTQVADIMINGIYWDNAAPQFFTKEDMRSPDFNIKVIADVTCDIAPVSSIPSTIIASTIANPIFGYNPLTEKEDQPYQEGIIDMMTVDNLPNELPRDASKAFGEQFIEHILGEHLDLEKSDILTRGSVSNYGDLGEHFYYLKNYLVGKE
ncbi:MAG: saccharopine dehydrogenase (NAD+, L-lysine-forming) [Maribacter sp.]|jgi:saccharopine dehydrogenase (NAD+, L-lysine-forming)